ncbi:hypothetical protein HPHPP13_1399 [Helicobacter pylori Hp P-13]|nr:hypothetical protein HPHPP13_1399 [Helicobacter pylori Hp P-13]
MYFDGKKRFLTFLKFDNQRPIKDRAKIQFNHPKQKSQSSLAFGMNATNSWYNISIHSYLAQEVRKVTPLEI